MAFPICFAFGGRLFVAGEWRTAWANPGIGHFVIAVCVSLNNNRQFVAWRRMAVLGETQEDVFLVGLGVVNCIFFGSLDDIGISDNAAHIMLNCRLRFCKFSVGQHFFYKVNYVRLAAKTLSSWGSNKVDVNLIAAK